MDGVGLAGTGLPVRDDGAIEPVQNVFQNWCSDLLVNLLLRGLNIEYSIIHEIHVVILHWVLDDQLRIRDRSVHRLAAVALLLLAVEWAEPAEHLYVRGLDLWGRHNLGVG